MAQWPQGMGHPRDLPGLAATSVTRTREGPAQPSQVAVQTVERVSPGPAPPSMRVAGTGTVVTSRTCLQQLLRTRLLDDVCAVGARVLPESLLSLQRAALSRRCSESLFSA